MGALRSSCTHAQETAADIAQSQGHSELYDILQINTSSSLSTKVCKKDFVNILFLFLFFYEYCLCEGSKGPVQCFMEN